MLQISSRRGGDVTINCLSKVLEHSLEQSRTRNHPDVTFLYRNILEHSISYVIIEV